MWRRAQLESRTRTRRCTLAFPAVTDLPCGSHKAAGIYQRLIAPLAKFLDRSVLQIGFGILSGTIGWETGKDRDLKLEQAVQFLNGPDFIPAENQPAQLDFAPDDSGHFRFPTPRPSEFAENNVVHGKLYRCADKWQERPVIVLLHGGSEVPGHEFYLHLCARRCRRAGYNVATLELPYHFQRRPRQYGRLSILGRYGAGLSPDYLRLAETYAQAIAEIRSLVGWLQAEGCPAVALAGASLGAYLAGLTVCCDARAAAAVMALPPSRQGNLLLQMEHVMGRRARELMLSRRVACEELDRTPLNISMSRPVISRENILLIEGMYDLMVLSGPEEIRQAWGQPEIWRLPQGHISAALMLPRLMGRILPWLAPRLETGRKNSR
jgi:pimeloyl-ACP methyl ester carboxylesterase